MKYFIKRKSVIILILIISIIFTSITTNLIMGIKVSAAVSILPLVYQFVASLLVILGINVLTDKTDPWNDTGNIRLLTENNLNKSLYNSFQMCTQILITAGVIKLENVKNMTKAKIIELFISTYATIEKGIYGNTILKFKDADKKNILINEILKDLRMNRILNDNEIIEENLIIDGNSYQKFEGYIQTPIMLKNAESQGIWKKSLYSFVGSNCRVVTTTNTYTMGQYFSSFDMLIASNYKIVMRQIGNTNRYTIKPFNEETQENEYFSLYNYHYNGTKYYWTLIWDSVKEIQIDLTTTITMEWVLNSFFEQRNFKIYGIDTENNLYVLSEELNSIGGGDDVIIDRIIEVPQVDPFVKDTDIKLWSEISTDISIPDETTIEDFINDDLLETEKTDILTDGAAITLDFPADDVIDFNPPYDDTQVVTGLGTISQWLNNIWSTIQQGIQTITESITNSGGDTEPDLEDSARKYKWTDMYFCLWEVLVACIGLLLRAGLFIYNLFNVEPDNSLLNSNMIQSLDFLKNQAIPNGMTYWNMVSAVFVLLICILVVRQAKRFV